MRAMRWIENCHMRGWIRNGQEPEEYEVKISVVVGSDTFDWCASSRKS